MLSLCVTVMQNFWNSYPNFDCHNAVFLQHTHPNWFYVTKKKSQLSIYSKHLHVVSLFHLKKPDGLAGGPINIQAWFLCVIWICKLKKIYIKSGISGMWLHYIKQPLCFCACAVFTVQGGCIHGSPSICIGNAFFVLRVERDKQNASGWSCVIKM